MCGIVGLFLKDSKLEPQLGAMLTDMLITMTDRGPESAGIAIYGRPVKGRAKIDSSIQPTGNRFQEPRQRPGQVTRQPGESRDQEYPRGAGCAGQEIGCRPQCPYAIAPQLQGHEFG